MTRFADTANAFYNPAPFAHNQFNQVEQNGKREQCRPQAESGIDVFSTGIEQLPRGGIESAASRLCDRSEQRFVRSVIGQLGLLAVEPDFRERPALVQRPNPE